MDKGVSVVQLKQKFPKLFEYRAVYVPYSTNLASKIKVQSEDGVIEERSLPATVKLKLFFVNAVKVIKFANDDIVLHAVVSSYDSTTSANLDGYIFKDCVDSNTGINILRTTLDHKDTMPLKYYENEPHTKLDDWILNNDYPFVSLIEQINLEDIHQHTSTTSNDKPDTILAASNIIKENINNITKK